MAHSTKPGKRSQCVSVLPPEVQKLRWTAEPHQWRARWGAFCSHCVSPRVHVSRLVCGVRVGRRPSHCGGAVGCPGACLLLYSLSVAQVLASFAQVGLRPHCVSLLYGPSVAAKRRSGQRPSEAHASRCVYPKLGLLFLPLLVRLPSPALFGVPRDPGV